MTDLEKSIIKTLAFFDVFNYPLTSNEIWKWIYKPLKKPSLLEIRQALINSEVLKNEVSLQEGFYSLKGREHIYLLRKQNNNLAERKFSKVIKLAKVYRFIPFIKLIAVCNSLAYSNAKETSDIDLFIIAQKNKIWLARFFAILIVKLLGSRPEEGNDQDAFCLTFFIDEESLNIHNVMLNNNDIYYPYWLKQLIPIYDPYHLHVKFLEANKWYLDYLPNGYPNQFAKEIKLRSYIKVLSQLIGWLISPPWLNRWTDDFYRYFQIKIIDRNLQSLINIDTRVIVNEQMLKFHKNDRRELFQKQWKDLVYNLLHKYEVKNKQII